uniref:Tsol15 n=1 Tax=Taenia solium TaxID=6204 RepID=D7PEW6_TAESO|nr:Tsol15 [Taenia solium]
MNASQMLERKETGKTSPLPNFYVSKVGSFFFQLSWNTLSLAESHPLYINIIATTNRPESKHEQQANFSRGKHDFVGLDSDTLYTVKAEVFGIKGNVFVYNTSVTTLPLDGKEKLLTTGGSALSSAISMVVFACMAVFFA